MESLIAFQVAVSVFAFFAITRVLLRLRDRQISLRSSLFWMGVWILALVLVYLPSFLTSLANIAGIGRGVDFVVYVSIGVLFYLVFRSYILIQNLQQEITKLTTHISVLEENKRRKQ